MDLIHDPNQDRGWFGKQFERAVIALSGVPRWVFFAALGAVLLFVMTAMRGMFLLLAAHPSPRSILQFLVALVVASTAGAVAGATFVVIRIPLRHLWRIGDLLTGAILGCVYMFTILVPAKFLFGDDSLKTTDDWFVAAAFGAGFGVVGTVVVWYNQWRLKNKPWNQVL